jgi:uncharacterized repeat protein (TIGR01451 family)
MVTLTILFTLTILGTVSASTDPTSLSLTISPSIINEGQSTTLTARLTRQGTSDGINGQTIHFYNDTGEIGTAVTTGTGSNRGTATFVYTPSNPGTQNIHAEYNGIPDPSGPSDGYWGSTSPTRTLTVNAPDKYPVANDDYISVAEDGTFNGNAATNDTSGDGSNVWSKLTDPTHGSVIMTTTGSYTYIPNANYNGPDSFTYRITDVDGDYEDATVWITITPVNDNPVAQNDAATTNEDTPTVVTVLPNDSDVEGNPLTVISVTQPANGSVTLVGGVITYTPAANWFGSETFTYTISDGNGGTATATVTMTVNSVNDAPVANDDTATTNEDTPVVVDVLANDSDVDGNSLIVIDVLPPSSGGVTLIGGVVTYIPSPNWSGIATFQYTIYDYNGGLATGTVTVTVNPINDAPVATGDSQTTAEDTPVNGAVTATDVDGDSLTFTEGTGSSHGTVVVNADGTYTYTPDANFNGNDSFTVIVSDGQGGTDEVTVYITVTPVNDAPVAVDNTVTTPEDTASGYDVLGNDYDDDGDILTIIGVTQPTNGVVVNYGTYVEYTPNSNYNGPDQFTYTISDGNGGTATATVYVTVNSVNDAPIAIDETVTTKEDTPVSGNLTGSDIDGDSLTFTQGSGPSHGTVIVNADGTYTYTPNANYYGSDSFTFVVNDGKGGTDEGTVNITVNRAVASVYVLTTVSKNNPAVGETVTITFKLGNKGPDAADNVVFTYVIPEGMEFVSLETQQGYPEAVYDPTTRTITWNLGTVPVLDPWLKVNLKVLKAGSFDINPTVTISTYDPTLENSIQTATINAVNTANAAGNTSSTVGMQETGVPFAGLILAILAVFAGLVMPKRK